MECSSAAGLYPHYIEGTSDGGFFDGFESVSGLRLTPFLCARSAMVSGLRSLGFTRMDELLVPPYLSHCVLSALGKVCFPTLTPSPRTRGILVYHQFGFPQNIEEIEGEARRNGWILLNDCATALFTTLKGESIICCGTFSVVSLAKFFHCGLGGGLWSRNEKLSISCSERDERDLSAADGLFDRYIQHSNLNDTFLSSITIHAIYGCMPIIKSIPRKSLGALPSSQEDITNEISRRKRIYGSASRMVGDRIPICGEGVVPFALPIFGERKDLEMLSEEIFRRFSFQTEVLHFDAAMNMLSPEYKDALVIGCHDGWEEGVILEILHFIRTTGA